MDPPPRSILAELALRLGGGQRERWATESLGHLLAASATCRRTLQDMLQASGAKIPEPLDYRTEVVESGAEGRPDVVGATGDSRHVIIEGKFWASLTDRQPVDYLKSLADKGCLLIVAPHRRCDLIRADLVRRCRSEHWSVEAQSATEVSLLEVDERWFMGVVSWRDLLGNLRDALLHEGDRRRASDVDQLDSLCDLEDSDAFLPLSSSDLSNPTPLRLYQYMELTEKVASLGSEQGSLHIQGYRSTGLPMGKYTRYLGYGNIQLALSVDLRRWTEWPQTPVGLEIYADPGDALRDLQTEQPPRAFYDRQSGRTVVPLMLRLHVEESEVVEDLLRQVEATMKLVRHWRSTATIKSPRAAESPTSKGEAV